MTRPRGTSPGSRSHAQRPPRAWACPSTLSSATSRARSSLCAGEACAPFPFGNLSAGSSTTPNTSSPATHRKGVAAQSEAMRRPLSSGTTVGASRASRGAGVRRDRRRTARTTKGAFIGSRHLAARSRAIGTSEWVPREARTTDRASLHTLRKGAQACAADEMGFKQREQKRKQKVAQRSAQTEAHRTGSAAGRWWLTIVSRDCCCNRCALTLRKGVECVYRRSPLEILCVSCGDRERIAYRPSLKWEKARPKGRRQR
jgi:hypothetical protein